VCVCVCVWLCVCVCVCVWLCVCVCVCLCVCRRCPFLYIMFNVCIQCNIEPDESYFGCALRYATMSPSLFAQGDMARPSVSSRTQFGLRPSLRHCLVVLLSCGSWSESCWWIRSEGVERRPPQPSPSILYLSRFNSCAQRCQCTDDLMSFMLCPLVPWGRDISQPDSVQVWLLCHLWYIIRDTPVGGWHFIAFVQWRFRILGALSLCPRTPPSPIASCDPYQ